MDEGERKYGVQKQAHDLMGAIQWLRFSEIQELFDEPHDVVELLTRLENLVYRDDDDG